MFVPSLRLGGLARLRACQVFVLSRRRLPSAFAFEQCVIDVRVAWMASRDGLPAGLPAGLPRIATFLCKWQVGTACLRDCLRACRVYLTQRLVASRDGLPAGLPAGLRDIAFLYSCADFA